MNGAIYALLALALIVVYAVTRIICIPQGEFISFSALSFAMMQTGRVPGTIYLLLAAGVLVVVLDGAQSLRQRSYAQFRPLLLMNIGLPLAVSGLVWWSVNSTENVLVLMLAIRN